MYLSEPWTIIFFLISSVRMCKPFTRFAVFLHILKHTDVTLARSETLFVDQTRNCNYKQ
jgi:hypothetical protein